MKVSFLLLKKQVLTEAVINELKTQNTNLSVIGYRLKEGIFA